ncbi:hypothetical protein HY745_05310 [Candidatus Desantisbacteria bacterium]|nr:hypothetical protein [Candidatus Desantisbacteria bacterium]
MQGLISVSGKVENKLVYLRGIFFISYPSNFRLELKGAPGNIEKIFIVSPKKIFLNDLSKKEISTFIYTQENFTDLTGLNYDPWRLLSYISGQPEFLPEGNYTQRIDKKYVILKNTDSAGPGNELWWDEEFQVISSMALLKGYKYIKILN